MGAEVQRCRPCFSLSPLKGPHSEACPCDAPGPLPHHSAALHPPSRGFLEVWAEAAVVRRGENGRGPVLGAGVVLCPHTCLMTAGSLPILASLAHL